MFVPFAFLYHSSYWDETESKIPRGELYKIFCILFYILRIFCPVSGNILVLVLFFVSIYIQCVPIFSEWSICCDARNEVFSISIFGY